MNVLDEIERGFLFRVARAVALVFTLVGLVATIVGGAIFLWALYLPSTEVDSAEIADAMAIQPQAGVPNIDTRKGAEADPRFRSAFNRVIESFDPTDYDREQLRAITTQWVRDYPRQDLVVEFLIELGDVLGSFPQDQKGTAFYTYAQLKFAKVRELESQRVAVSHLRATGLWAALVGLGATALFSLALVLLQIERNTRPD